MQLKRESGLPRRVLCHGRRRKSAGFRRSRNHCGAEKM